MILGDMQGGDKHCGSVIGYSDKMARLCRKCNVSGEESGNPLIQCKDISMVKVRQFLQEENVAALKSICQRNVHVAWFDVNFAGCEQGVFSAGMPVEALHPLEVGMIKDILVILFEGDLKLANCGLLDILVREIYLWPKQLYCSSGSNKDMPRLLFKDGCTILTKIASSHNVGIMLTVYVVSLQDKGKSFFEKVFRVTRMNKMELVKKQNILETWRQGSAKAGRKSY